MTEYEKSTMLEALRENDKLIDDLLEIRRALVEKLSREDKNELWENLMADHQPHHGF